MNELGLHFDSTRLIIDGASMEPDMDVVEGTLIGIGRTKICRKAQSHWR